MVSTSLRDLLLAEMQLTPAVEVTLLSPDEAGVARRVNLYLYRVDENEYLANGDSTTGPGNQLVPPPLSLNLTYLVTVYAQNDTVLGNVPAHEILGEVMRVLRQHSPIPRAHLHAGLRDAGERLQMVCRKPDPEELSRIWSTFAKPYRLSVLYQVSCVQLDLPRTPPEFVPKRIRRVGVPAVTTVVAPPVIDDMTPVRGLAGTTVTFSGRHLAGRLISVAVAGRVLLDRHDAADTLPVPLPDDLSEGTYEIRAAVSPELVRTFLFEVTS
nr:DUF4255 domain-containing protein [Nocardia bovistercoris]